MKKFFLLIFSLLLVLVSQKISAQNFDPFTDIFCEDFDSSITKWEIENTSIPTNRPNDFTRDSIVTMDNSPGAATGFVGNRTESYLTTPQLATDSFLNIGVQFAHIAYINRFDDARVEYTFDNGTTWRRFPFSSYTGTSTYEFIGDLKFSKLSQPTLWHPLASDSNWVIPANTNAWVVENFDLTPILNAELNRPDSFRIRLALVDDPASAPGRTGIHRWVIDNFCVRGSDCEVIPPNVDLLDPPRLYPVRYEGKIYSTGPFSFDAQITDNSTVDTAYVVFSLRRDTSTEDGIEKWTTLIELDTLPMDRRPGNNFETEIPKNLDSFKVEMGDSIIWKLVAIDGSDCRNFTQDPPRGFSRFLAFQDLPKSCGTQPIFEYPYYQTFNSGNFITGVNGSIGEDWSNVEGDFHDWWVGTGATSTDGTGPSDDIPGGGKYLYVESSNFPDSMAILVTPCFDLDENILTNGLVKFYVNMNTSTLEDTINVDIFDPTPSPAFPFGRFVNDVIPPITGNKGDNWLAIEFSTFPLRNTVTQIRFRGKPGNNSGFGDMALDSFKLVDAPLIDLRLNSFDLPPFGPAGANDPAKFVVQNMGVDTARNITFAFEVCPDNDPTNCQNSNPINWTGTLAPGEIKTLEFPAETYTVPRGLFTYKGWLDFNGDNNPTNDTAFTRSNGITSNSLKYRDNFDRDTTWRTFAESGGSLSNSWELGTPNFNRLNSTFNGPNAWDILLNRQYTGTGITNSLLSPFLDFSGGDSIILAFMNNRAMDTTQDGVWIEYSIDRGLTWNVLPFLQDPNRIRWYNNSLSSGGLGGQPVFASVSSCVKNNWSGWYESGIYLPDTLNNQSEVLFRFQFFAENDNDGNDGMSIDNILIYDPDPLDIEPQIILSPNSKCSLSDSMRINTVFKNRGLNRVDSFEIEYRVRHVPTNAVQNKSEMINRSVYHRDTLNIRSVPTFDLTRLGDYIIDVIAKLPGDGCSLNDTLTKLVENIDGCSLRFVMELSQEPNRQLPCDSSVWRFSYTSGDRDYEVSGAYNDPNFPIGMGKNVPGDTITDLFVCIKNNSQVRFTLDDFDGLINNYSFIAFNGSRDTIIREQIPGDIDSPDQFFNWNCPPKLSATPLNVILDQGKIQLPTSKVYTIESKILNNGLDSLDSVRVTMQLDNTPPVTIREHFVPDLKFLKKRTVVFPSRFLSPGEHCITVWTSFPNGQQDLKPDDDTTQFCFTIMDTISLDGVTNPESFRPPFCDDFEVASQTVPWIGFNSYTYEQRNFTFEPGTPSTPNINGANSGNIAWVTNADGDYNDLDSSSLLTPFMFMKKDSCYRLSFSHNYYILDSINDGGTFQITFNEGKKWRQVGNANGDSAVFGQLNWFNTNHILSIPDNKNNAGWTFISNGWERAESVVTTAGDGFVAFRWRFESDGSGTSDGWAIDDFCFESIDGVNCFPVGLEEAELKENEFYLGQNIPNPAVNKTEIPYYLPHSGEVSFVVSNMLGQPVYQEQMTKPQGEGLIDLDLQGLSKGVYFYWMTFEDQRISKKLIISK